MQFAFFLLLIIYVCANIYLYRRTIQAFAYVSFEKRVVLTICFWFLAFSYFGAMGLRETQLPDSVLYLLFFVGSAWLALLLYSVLLLFVADILKLILPIKRNTLWYIFPLTCALLVYGYVNYKTPRKEYLGLTFEREVVGEGIRLVAITDVHLGYGTGVDALKGFVDQINQQSPDVVLIVGDLIDNSLKPLFHDSFDKVLSMIKAPQGIYMVPGNHEYISGIDDVADYLRGTSIVLLRDSVVTLSNGIQIVGRDDRMNKKRKPLKELLVHTNEKHPIIVLDHQPYNLNITDSLKVDLQISGHTHHGQLFPFNLLTDYLYEQSHGYRKWKNSHIWVSSGLSLWGPPFRIGTKSDFAIIDIMHAANVSVE